VFVATVGARTRARFERDRRGWATIELNASRWRLKAGTANCSSFVVTAGAKRLRPITRLHRRQAAASYRVAMLVAQAPWLHSAVRQSRMGIFV
jgi:hypothetical protein